LLGASTDDRLRIRADELAVRSQRTLGLVERDHELKLPGELRTHFAQRIDEILIVAGVVDFTDQRVGQDVAPFARVAEGLEYRVAHIFYRFGAGVDVVREGRVHMCLLREFQRSRTNGICQISPAAPRITYLRDKLNGQILE